MENNIRGYVERFNLIKTGPNNFSKTSGECVFRIKEEYVEIKTHSGRWRKHRHGDLFLSVLNSIPLHG